MRYPASEKLEIIQLVEQSHLPARHTLQKLGIPRATFHRWYDRFLTGGVEGKLRRSAVDVPAFFISDEPCCSCLSLAGCLITCFRLVGLKAFCRRARFF
jgi:hypothetical protein